MKILFLSLCISLTTIVSFFEKTSYNSGINKFEIVDFSSLNSVSSFGNKSFNEVRIIRSTLIKDVFTDVITKYQQKDEPTTVDDDITSSMLANNKLNIIISKYSL